MDLLSVAGAEGMQATDAHCVLLLIDVQLSDDAVKNATATTNIGSDV